MNQRFDDSGDADVVFHGGTRFTEPDSSTRRVTDLELTIDKVIQWDVTGCYISACAPRRDRDAVVSLGRFERFRLDERDIARLQVVSDVVRSDLSKVSIPAKPATGDRLDGFDTLHRRRRPVGREVNYPTLLAHGFRRSLLEGGASCFHDALCRYRRIHRERSLHRR